ncbi:TnpA family transposase [Spinactinospora alkalitolerans]|uniref:TnpA family transposase n=1 Tax=Spinactinospora alkalitolerans TaxID=687207 RepID=A0A852U0T9_9ACTN|nr:DUF4158 domain-containing protein [Spinactinospora alkalitolerans]NYE47620.1 TnpA family transposase [Spinactinospora alkalitolerans]
MSLEFLSAARVEAFGRFTGAPSQSELDRFCLLSDTDVARVRQRRRPQNRLGFAVQPNRLWHLARYGLGSKASTIRGLSPARKTATLVAMVRA